MIQRLAGGENRAGVDLLGVHQRGDPLQGRDQHVPLPAGKLVERLDESGLEQLRGPGCGGFAGLGEFGEHGAAIGLALGALDQTRGGQTFQNRGDGRLA